MIIKQVQIFGEDGKFHRGSIRTQDGIITEIIPEGIIIDTDDEELDGEGLKAIPGLVDIHFHGCKGADFCDGTGEAIDIIARYEASAGVTSICPATMTLSVDELKSIMTNAANWKQKASETDEKMHAELVGINMEGPFICEARKGAQKSDYIIPCSTELFRELNSLSGSLIRLVDIAPEIDGALKFIDEVKDEVVISVAHTDADYEETMAAFEHGASHVTHLYNAMPALHHRKPGVIGAACDTEKCHVELICDGIHIHPSVVRTTFKMFGTNRMILISDSMMATGMEDGKYALGGQDVFVTGNRAALADGTIAGSATNLFDCMKHAVKDMKIPLEDALLAATRNPAIEIGIYDRAGSISIGKKADILLVDDELNLKHVMIRGSILQ